MTATIIQVYSIASGTQVLTEAVSAGDALLAIGFNTGNGVPLSSGVTVDSDTCTKVSSFANAPSSGYELWVAPNMAAAGAGTVTVNVNNLGTGYVAWFIVHCSGLVTSSPLDIVAFGTNVTSPVTSSTFTPNYSNELSIVTAATNSVVTPTGGYSIIYTTGVYLLAMNPISAGSQSVTYLTTGANGDVAVYTFRALDSVGSLAVLPTDAMFFGLE